MILSDFTTVFIKKEKVAQNTYSYFFEKPNSFTYFPGQYIRLSVPHENPDSRGTTRMFSLASSPLEDYLLITTKEGESTYKKELHAKPSGSSFSFFGPIGRLLLPEESSTSCIYLAGGIGITPFRSHLSYMLQKKLPYTVYVLVSFSRVEDFVYYDEFMRYAQLNPKMKIVYTITKPELSSPWNGEKGRISKEMIQRYIPSLQNSFVYCAGPIAMVDGLITLITEIGVKNEQIRKENFVGY